MNHAIMEPFHPGSIVAEPQGGAKAGMCNPLRCLQERKESPDAAKPQESGRKWG